MAGLVSSVLAGSSGLVGKVGVLQEGSTLCHGNICKKMGLMEIFILCVFSTLKKMVACLSVCPYLNDLERKILKPEE